MISQNFLFISFKSYRASTESIWIKQSKSLTVKKIFVLIYGACERLWTLKDIMLPTHTSASELLNVVISEDIDKSCDAAAAADDECSGDNSGDANSTSTIKSITSVAKSTATMTIPSKADSLAARRPTSLILKPLITTNTTSEGKSDDKSGQSSDTRTRNCTQKHITIGFQNIVYNAQQRLCWDRSKWI